VFFNFLNILISISLCIFIIPFLISIVVIINIFNALTLSIHMFQSLLQHPSESKNLDMFLIMCQPVKYGRANDRNQEMLVDVLLSDSLPRIQKSLSFIFSGDANKLGSVADPEKLLRMFNSTIVEGNVKCGQQLHNFGFTIASTIKSLDGFRHLKHLISEKVKATSTNEYDMENAIWSSRHYCIMVSLFFYNLLFFQCIFISESFTLVHAYI
jgi:hypothetical protein